MSQLPNSVGTIGAGNMAEAILGGLIAAGLDRTRLRASDPLAARRSFLQTELGIGVTADNADVVRNSELVVLAVKPQQLDPVLASLPKDASPVYLSIVAGVRLTRLREALGPDARVLRSMPNTPALVRAGVSALATEPDASESDLDLAQAVLEAVGSVVRVPEALLDAVTGLSGSGPAYVFLLIEALGAAGTAVGLPSEVATTLALQTVLGSARLAEHSPDTAAELRAKVTSPGGTTEAGLAALARAGFADALAEAVQAATARSRELAGDS